MSVEIERKFLIDWNVANSMGVFKTKPDRIQQCYFQVSDSVVRRIRSVTNEDSVSFIVTEKSRVPGMSRQEYEFPVSQEQAVEYFKAALGGVITKKRYIYIYDNLRWEVDVFESANSGLVIAEVELISETQKFELPKFIRREVTNDSRYYNHNLSDKPYNEW